ncbi:SusC/RagA family TonB-linked outer membrane protein [Sphingobacterium griseoflavum]|uniref:SusC/RagA family TonB-linked outer membrane protein n=2 Tax=Sphingobacterium griseoflavum TaxID=1474952 RepID=A0ABQ3HRL3_9SPHI|nr:SusC/RagA family TonB-linked outer membrane protein [Sphingobacterium griseoflavum]
MPQILSTLFLILFFQLTGHAFSQKIDVSANGDRLSHVLKSISKQSGYKLFYNSEILKDSRPVTLSLRDVSLAEGLEAVFSNQPLSYRLEEQTIVIRKKKGSPSHPAGTSAMQTTVSGTVRDTVGRPLENVNIALKGTKQVTRTGAAGGFSLPLPNARGVLLVSSTGYVPQEIAVTGEHIAIVLRELKAGIDEVVVVGYGTVRKADFTGAAVTVNARDIEKRPLTNVMNALQGAGPGVQTTAPTGSPGSQPTIRIRGFGSYSAESSPLIVVDGVEYTGGTANINPADVETITTLKDASTIAIFGSRGANGVIMITTKRGNVGQQSMDFQLNFGTNANMMPQYNVVSPGEYYELMWESYKNSMIFGNQRVPADIAAQIASGQLARNSEGLQQYNGSTYQDLVQLLGNYNAFNVANDKLITTNGRLNPDARLLYADDLNWEEQAARLGRRNEYGMSYSAGAKHTDLFVSLNYLNEQGWGINSDFDAIRARINANTKIRGWLRTGLNVNANYNKSNNNTFGSGVGNPFYFARQMAPIYPVHVHDPLTGTYILDDQGNRIYDIGDLSAQFGLFRPFNSGRHAIAENLWNLNVQTRDFVGGRGYLDVDILPWLTFNATMSFDLRNQRAEAYQNPTVGDGAPAGRYSQNWDRRLQWTFFQTLQVKKSFDKHHVSGTLGHESVDFKNESMSGLRQGEGFSNFYVFSNFTDINSLNSTLGEFSMESYFLRANYHYDQRYYLSTSVRMDGDSKIPPANRWSKFWSVGVAWRLEKEPFFNVDWVNALKVRTSYGRLGNNNFGADYYPYQAGYQVGVNNVGFPGTTLARLGSPDLLWESQKPFDVGVDFEFLDTRLRGSFEFYDRTSDGLLFDVPRPFHNGSTTGGAFSVQQNVGGMRNRGIELSLTGGLIRKQDFKWDLTANITTLKNKILRMPAETPSIVSSPYRREVGYSIYDFYTRDFYGVDPENGRVLYRNVVEGADLTSDQIRIINRGNGGMDTVTYDHNLARQDWLGKQALADAYGSIINHFTYKNLDFNVIILYSIGGWAMDNSYATFMSPGPSNGQNLHKDLLNGWRKPGDVTDIPRMDMTQTAQFGAASSRWLTSASHVGLSALNIAYRLPESFAEKCYLRRVRAFISAENLYYWTARKGINTMTNFAGASGTGSYSPQRTISFGVNFGL